MRVGEGAGLAPARPGPTMAMAAIGAIVGAPGAAHIAESSEESNRPV